MQPLNDAGNDVPDHRLTGNAGFIRVFSAGIVSVSGYSLTSVILIWLVFAETHSSIAVALLGIAETAGYVLFSLPSGTIVDRYRRKSLMVASDLIRCAAIGTLTIILLFFGFSFIVIAAIVFAVSGFTTVFEPAENSLLPVIVPKKSLPGANGLVMSSRSLAQFASNSIAGVVIALVGPVAGLAINVGTYFVSAVLLMTVKVREKTAETATREKQHTFVRDTRDGVKWLLGNKGLFQLTVSATFLNFFFTLVFTFIVFFTSDVLHRGAIIFGLILGLFALGDAAGSISVSRTGALHHTGLVWIVFYGLIPGAALLAVSLLHSFVLSFPLFLLMGFFSGFAGNTWLTSVQIIVPGEMQGRYFGIDSLVSYAVIPLSQAVGGILIAYIGILETYIVSAVLMILVGVAFLIPRSLRALRVPPELSA